MSEGLAERGLEANSHALSASLLCSQRLFCALGNSHAISTSLNLNCESVVVQISLTCDLHALSCSRVAWAEREQEGNCSGTFQFYIGRFLVVLNFAISFIYDRFLTVPGRTWMAQL